MIRFEKQRAIVALVMLVVLLPAAYGSYRWWDWWIRSIAQEEARDVYETRYVQKELMLRDLDASVRARLKELDTAAAGGT